MIPLSLRRPSLAATLDPAMVRRRRALRVAPPSNFVELKAWAEAYRPAAPAHDWRDDLRFFLGCYAAGLAFFLILLS